MFHSQYLGKASLKFAVNFLRSGSLKLQQSLCVRLQVVLFVFLFIYSCSSCSICFSIHLFMFKLFYLFIYSCSSCSICFSIPVQVVLFVFLFVFKLLSAAEGQSPSNYSSCCSLSICFYFRVLFVFLFLFKVFYSYSSWLGSGSTTACLRFL